MATKQQVETVSDMMRALEEEIEAVKTGKLAESAARVVSRFRSLQLKTAELNLQYRRMMRSKDVGEMKLIPASTPEKAKT